MKKFVSTASAFYLLLCQNVYAGLPTAAPPSNNPDSNNWLEVIKGYLKDGTLLVGLAISVCGFLWLSWIALADINQARQGRKEWGEVGVTVIGGAAVFLFVSYMLAQAAGVIQ